MNTPKTQSAVRSSELVSSLCVNWRSAADANQSAAEKHAAIYGKANDIYVECMERARTLRDCADHLQKAANVRVSESARENPNA